MTTNCYRIIALIITILIIGCSPQHAVGEKHELTGDWISSERASEWGIIVMELKFSEKGKLKIKTKFLDASTNDNKLRVTASYIVNQDGSFSSPEMNSGDPIFYTILEKEMTLMIDGESIKLIKK